MPNQIADFYHPRWVKSEALSEYVENPSVPHCIVDLVKGAAIYAERHLDGHIWISCKSMFNCGF
ncbi:MAG: hypothetical protein ABW139_01015 [Candidatus Thiodiazotropha sp. DIVDIV]